MKKTEICIEALQQEISGIAEHAFYAAAEMREDDDNFGQFMEQLINQIEHVACEYLIVQVLGKNPIYLERITSQPTACDVQMLINKE